jgi:hemerythrin
MTRIDMPALLTGHAAIDEDHAVFVRLHEAILSAPPDLFSENFAILFEHLSQHFSSEETLMHAVGYPDPHHHAAEHGRILSEMRSFLKQASNGRTLMAKAYLSDMLTDWFISHIRLLDADLARYAREHTPVP